MENQQKALIRITCDTCHKTHEVRRTNEIPEHVVSMACNWCPKCEDRADDYYEERYNNDGDNLIADVSGWLEFEGNESIFNDYAKQNCICKFDDGTECRFEDEHPMAILTHFRCK